MKIIRLISLLALPAILFATSCKDSKSYNEYLDDEEKSVNAFLAQHKVELTIPADTVFQTGEDAPFYKIDEEGNVYMQVIKAGDRKNNRAEAGQNIYFRFQRMSIHDYAQGDDQTWVGNSNTISYNYFSFDNYELESTYQYGAGIQMPLKFLGIDCEVNLLVKSSYGFYDEISDVVPYLYHLTYYKQKV